MFVIKRSGKKEPVFFDKITSRIRKLSYELNVQPELIAQKTIQGVHDNIKTTELDTLSAENAAASVLIHPDYAIIAARIEASNLHKETDKVFSNVMELLYEKDIVTLSFIQTVRKFQTELDSSIIHDRDFQYDYFGFKTLEKSYLLKIDDRIVERPQFLLMRVAVAVHKDLNDILEAYERMSRKEFTPATPTLYNAGTKGGSLASCYLGCVQDSIEEIFKGVCQCAMISKMSGGIGMSMTSIRSKGSHVQGTNGYSSGLIPFAKVFNATARAVDQGGRRKGSIAMYLEPWHPDIYEFISLRKNHGAEELRARDLFPGLWIPDLFMKRVEENGEWSLFDPHDCYDLVDLHSDAFETRYVEYEVQGKARRVVQARELMMAIIQAQIETGTPYMCYKDSVNRKSNHSNLGTVRNSNLCTEIVQYSRMDEIATCNLASISLPSCIQDNVFNFQKLREITHHVTIYLNRVIDVTNTFLPEIKKANENQRSIGIGVQGLQDVFYILKLPFTSSKAKQLNKSIFETIYYCALEKSCELAKIDGVYAKYEGSPISQGILQFDMWNVKASEWNWDELRQNIQTYGVRNSLLVAPMPTASTSQILGNTEAFEVRTSNIYTRRTLSGEFIVINQYLIKDLIDLGMWNPNMKNQLVRNHGSVQDLDIPQNIKDLYKDVWETSQKDIIDMAADRAPFIDQSQSMNIHIADPTVSKIMSMHFYGWKKGLKTGMYYLRTKAASDAIQFTVQKDICSIENKDACEMCSS